MAVLLSLCNWQWLIAFASGASQIQATFYLYLGGTIASLLLSFVISGGIKPPNMQNAQWWQYLTGFLGSFYILFMFIAAPKIGSASTLLWVFLGQMLFATLLAHFGFLGLDVRKVEPIKLIGLGTDCYRWINNDLGGKASLLNAYNLLR